MTQSPPQTTPTTARDEIAYVAPMAAFMALIFLGSYEGYYPLAYIARTLLVAVLLISFWPRYTRVSWTHWQWGVLFGVLGILQWVGMEKLLLHLWPTYPKMGGGDPFNPFKEFATPAAAWSFILIRWAGATLVVPVMEELFWRDFLHRQLIAPNDFKLAAIGEWDTKAFWLIPALFSLVHVQWATAIVWGLMIGLLLVWKKSLGACIIMHATTNFLLGAYVLWTGDWYFW